MDQKNTGSKKLEQYINKLEERRELEAMNMYNPFGRAGAGAPLRDAYGNLMNKKANLYENLTNNNFQSNNQVNYKDRVKENLEKNYHSNYNANQFNFNNGNNHQDLNNLYENSNLAYQNSMNTNLNKNLNYNIHQPNINYPSNNLINQNQNQYYNEISRINLRNNFNNQHLNNIMSNFNIQNQDYPNSSKNRTLSANMILDQNKHVYSQNIINDINRVYEESSKVQNYNLQSNLTNPINTIMNPNYQINNDVKIINPKNPMNNSPQSNKIFNCIYFLILGNIDPSKLQQKDKITNYYTLEENENNFKRKKIYQDELAKQIEEKQREKEKIKQKEREIDTLEEENYKIYL